jgi:hypothetical protein
MQQMQAKRVGIPKFFHREFVDVRIEWTAFIQPYGQAPNVLQV